MNSEEYVDNELCQRLWAGHAHAGVLLVLAAVLTIGMLTRGVGLIGHRRDA